MPYLRQIRQGSRWSRRQHSPEARIRTSWSCMAVPSPGRTPILGTRLEREREKKSTKKTHLKRGLTIDYLSLITVVSRINHFSSFQSNTRETHTERERGKKSMVLLHAYRISHSTPPPSLLHLHTRAPVCLSPVSPTGSGSLPLHGVSPVQQSTSKNKRDMNNYLIIIRTPFFPSFLSFSYSSFLFSRLPFRGKDNKE